MHLQSPAEPALRTASTSAGVRTRLKRAGSSRDPFHQPLREVVRTAKRRGEALLSEPGWPVGSFGGPTGAPSRYQRMPSLRPLSTVTATKCQAPSDTTACEV